MILDWPETAPLSDQVLYLAQVLDRNPVVQAVFSVAAGLSLPDWYLAAGGVSQTVWNVYEEKTRRWATRWPRLTVIPW